MFGNQLLLGAMLTASILGIIPSVEPYPYPEHWNGDGQGRTFVLYRKHDVGPMSQGPAPSCVGAATVKALELMHGERFSAEWAYGVSRSHFQHHVSPFNGSFCGWSAQAIKDVGALPARDYSLLGDDLSTYSAERANLWARGPPEKYEAIAERYRSGFVKIESWSQLRDAIANGVPVIVGSSVGYGKRSGAYRTRDGRLRARWWSRWRHAMVICGVSDGRSKRALILNSWGSRWVRGPKWLGDEPAGSFWASKGDILDMIEQGDAYAILPIPGMDF